jgi:folylpolyglutamate synthase/dihydrofolate synthase
MERYDKEIDFIFNQFPMYQKVGDRAFKPGLDGMREFDVVLGRSHRKFKAIHIAGTNGKGSVSHMLASVFMRCGLKTGLYTSPHLVDFRERIKIDGEMISKERVLEFVDKWKSYMVEKRPSFFEITTAMAFDYFASEKVDIAVIETGLGGRLDSTNIITPILSIITNISMDHTAQLGGTISEIAREKGGIIKESVPVVIGEATRSTKDIFENIASGVGARICFAERGQYRDVKLSDYELDLRGNYQVHNLRTVLTALSILGEEGKFISILRDVNAKRTDDIKIGNCNNSNGGNSVNNDGWSDENIRIGLKSVVKSTGLRGRWERLSENPLVICDTGHNLGGLTEVFSQLRDEKYRRLFIIIGFVADKDIAKIINILPQQAYYYFTQAKIERALSAGELYEKCYTAGLKGEVKESVEQAVKDYMAESHKGDLLFIGGSNFIIAEALPLF